MIADHRKDIARFQMQARTGDPATRRLARETLPHLQHHLQMALALQRGR
jgi:predicted outer membrane protein